MILFDIDHFKLVNDKFGHEVGDIILKEVTDRVQQEIRNSDLFARYGGEEFIMLVPNSDTHHASQLAEKMRIKLAATEMHEVGTVTASFGITQYRDNENSHELLSRVDEALYRAKSAGRNTVVCI